LIMHVFNEVRCLGAKLKVIAPTKVSFAVLSPKNGR